MPMEEFLEMVYYNPELDPLLNEAIAIWDNEHLQIHQMQHKPPLHPQPPHQPQQHVPQPPQHIESDDEISDEEDLEGDFLAQESNLNIRRNVCGG